MPHIQPEKCQKPSCDEEATESYKDAHGNRLRLCGRHYFEQVSGAPVLTSGPLWDRKSESKSLFEKLSGK